MSQYCNEHKICRYLKLSSDCGYCTLADVPVALAMDVGEAKLFKRLRNCNGIIEWPPRPPLPSEQTNIQQPPYTIKSASDFLQSADNTMKERGKTYDKSNNGESERSMGKTVTAFNEITGHNLKESDGWLLMLLLKQTRQYSTDTYHEDSALDSVAYSALLAEALNNESD